MSRFGGPRLLMDSGFSKVFRLKRFIVFGASGIGVLFICGDTRDLRK